MKRPDGSFDNLYPDGSRDVGTRDNDGNLVIAYADGSSEVITREGNSTFTDPFGVTTRSITDETGRIVESSSDGWSLSTSADGKSVVITGPNGEAETAIIGEDRSVLKTFEDGSTGRYFPETGQVSYTSVSGETFNMRVDKNGNLVATDEFGSIYEYNPKTNTTNILDADGNGQTSQRNSDGTYEVTLEDNTTIEFDASGVPLAFGNEVVEDGEFLAINIANPCATCVSEAVWDKENAMLELDLGGNGTITTQLSSDGVVTVETEEGNRTYDPSTGVTGSTTITFDAGVATILGSNGGTTSISEDGTSIEIVDANGTQATATESDIGYTVVVDLSLIHI